MSKQKRILIIEDDVYIRDLYAEILGEAGYDVATAVDGEEGLVKAKIGGYHLILLDVMMPKLDGLGVLHGLQQNPPQNPNGQVILLTNLAQDEVVQEALKTGANDFVIKSDLNPQELLTRLESYLT
ncbi:response regulator [Candidatus Roizmanbacteria bacterium CG_4_10_14_0_2_um_filter_36_9]|uniref:Response regulator n=1 Tax=Candidatus Roizmanbacteria bacterium CG_4_10_14_0_2_um_filter_36_9 TaxID=1974823 RepID=A0A2M7U2C1_9BACT|nr:MAG: response regulator [Candidatus Roizmanbacteria bacterium CG_4_10_14_0_2_um_filter_36_9]